MTYLHTYPAGESKKKHIKMNGGRLLRPKSKRHQAYR